MRPSCSRTYEFLSLWLLLFFEVLPKKKGFWEKCHICIIISINILSFAKNHMYRYTIYVDVVCMCVCVYKGITVHNCLSCFTDSTLIMDVTLRPRCWWIIDGGSTVTVRDCAVMDECFVLPFVLYIWRLAVSPYLPGPLSATMVLSHLPVHLSCTYTVPDKVIFFPTPPPHRPKPHHLPLLHILQIIKNEIESFFFWNNVFHSLGLMDNLFRSCNFYCGRWCTIYINTMKEWLFWSY